MTPADATTALAFATHEALSAAESGDLDALDRALEIRKTAIESGALPTPAILAEGDRMAELLRGLMRELTTESARLDQIQRGFASTRGLHPHLDYRG